MLQGDVEPMEITFLLTGIKEIDADLANFLFDNGFDDCTPYSYGGKVFLSLEDDSPLARLEQLDNLGVKAEIFKTEKQMHD